MSLGFSNNTDCAFAEILVQSLPTENRRQLEESFLLPVSQNNAYGHKLVVFCSYFPLLCMCSLFLTRINILTISFYGIFI